MRIIVLSILLLFSPLVYGASASFTLSSTAEVEDNWMNSAVGHATDNNGTDTFLVVGQKFLSGERRALIRFNGLADSLSDGRLVSSCSLRVIFNSTSTFGANDTLWVLPIRDSTAANSRPWTEDSSCWSGYDGCGATALTWATTGCRSTTNDYNLNYPHIADFKSSNILQDGSLALSTIGAGADTGIIDLTDFMNYRIYETNNNGFIIYPDVAATTDSAIIYSSEASSGNVPLLSVHYDTDKFVVGTGPGGNEQSTGPNPFKFFGEYACPGTGNLIVDSFRTWFNPSATTGDSIWGAIHNMDSSLLGYSDSASSTGSSGDYVEYTLAWRANDTLTGGTTYFFGVECRPGPTDFGVLKEQWNETGSGTKWVYQVSGGTHAALSKTASGTDAGPAAIFYLTQLAATNTPSQIIMLKVD